MKRLEQGRFNYDSKREEKQALNWTQLKLILEGIDLKNITKKKGSIRISQRI
jgi:transposase